jgi:hypothetical protein
MFQPASPKVVDDQIFRQQSDAEAIEGGIADSLVVVRTDHTADGHAGGSLRSGQPPFVVTRPHPPYDAVVIGEVLPLPRPTTPVNLIRRRDRDARGRAQSAFDQGNSEDVADRDGEIEPVLDHVAQIVPHHHLDRGARMTCQQNGYALHQLYAQ